MAMADPVMSDQRLRDSRQRRIELVHALARHAKPNTYMGLFWFLKNQLVYWGCLAGSLIADPIAVKLLFAMAAGFSLAGFIVLGHDAAHGALVRGSRLNRLLAEISLLQVYHNFGLWIPDHHGLHHPMTNGPHKGTYTPYSPSEFARLSKSRQLLERFYRAPNILGVAVHYGVERWWHSLVVPRGHHPTAARRSGWIHAGGVAVYAAVLVSIVASLGRANGLTPASAIASSVLLPFFVAFFLIGLVEFAQHTHPRVPWTKEVADRAFFERPELASVHLETPAWLGYALMNILDHPVHHLLPKIPCYRLRAAQSDLNQRLGGEAVRARFGLRWYVDTMKTCKLYDFEARRWVAFGAAVSAATPVGDEFAV